MRFFQVLSPRLLACVWCVLSSFSRVRLFATPWTIALQAPLSMRFSKQEYWSGLPFPSPGDLPDPWTESVFPMSPALVGKFFTTSATWGHKAASYRYYICFFQSPYHSFPEGGQGNPLQYSCLENPMDRGAWRAIVHGVAKSQT